ncbi:MAG: LysR family transcriptional regulator [Erythrobacter sp.]|jgi:DNA-binding transcriptional LysR family regulator|nr:LysR family transcriptional regulator [Erythrobacter sp.]
MELRQIRYFIEIVRSASFGRAAEKLNITQPALSKSIRNLEQSLDVKLLERHPNGVVPTDFGDLFLEYASLISAEIDRATAEIEQMKGTGRGIVRVGAGATMMQYVVPQAVRAFMAMGTDATVTFRQGLRGDLTSCLRRGDVDLIVGSIKSASAEEDEEFHHELILRDTIVVVADENHPLANARAVEIADLSGYDWVLPEGTEDERDRLGRVLRSAGLQLPHCAISTPSSNFMSTMLHGSHYLSYLPQALLQAGGNYAHLKPLNLTTALWDPVDVGVTYRRRGIMLRPVRRFINRLIEAGQDIEKRAAGATILSTPARTFAVSDPE